MWRGRWCWAHRAHSVKDTDRFVKGHEVGALSDEAIDAQSQSKACALFDAPLLSAIEVGTLRGLQQIHSYLFGGLYPFAGQIRTLNIAKGGFQFALAQYLPATLRQIDQMPCDTFDAAVDKYVEMNVAHPFMEGNGRAGRVWLDRMLVSAIGQCVDWSRVGKYEYLEAMRRSVADSGELKALLRGALTDRVHDRELFVKGIDYSYYYER